MTDEIEYKGHTIAIVQDSDSESPREWDNLGTMVCFHKRYALGDNGTGYKSADFGSWNELKEQIEKDNEVAVILPIYMYDHSGITIQTSSFNDRWDSGQIGFIYVTKEKAREQMQWKKITSARIEKLEQYLQGEVETYDQFLTGDVYGYRVEGLYADDSCYGFYGSDVALQEAKEIVDYEVKAVEIEAFLLFAVSAEAFAAGAL